MILRPCEKNLVILKERGTVSALIQESLQLAKLKTIEHVGIDPTDPGVQSASEAAVAASSTGDARRPVPLEYSRSITCTWTRRGRS